MQEADGRQSGMGFKGTGLFNLRTQFVRGKIKRPSSKEPPAKSARADGHEPEPIRRGRSRR